MRVEAAVGLQRARADRQARLEQLGEALEVAREAVVRRVGDAGCAGSVVFELAAQQRGVAVRLARLGEAGVLAGGVAEVVEAAGVIALATPESQTPGLGKS